jgi:hypothetical protein
VPSVGCWRHFSARRRPRRDLFVVEALEVIDVGEGCHEGPIAVVHARKFAVELAQGGAAVRELGQRVGEGELGDVAFDVLRGFAEEEAQRPNGS